MNQTTEMTERTCSLPPASGEGPARWTVLGAAGAVLSGLLASACCIGPLLAVVVGVGGSGMMLRLAPYRPVFAALMVAFLAFGFYRAYVRPRRQGCGCSPASLRVQRVILWLSATLAAVLFWFPWIQVWFAN